MLQTLGNRKKRIKRAGCMLLTAALLAGSFCRAGYAQETTSRTEEMPQTEKNICLGIDNRHVYEGMNQSFSQGYLPTVDKNTFEVIIPFTVQGDLKDDKITVELVYPSERDSPFEQKNYQKDVAEEHFVFDKEERDTFLYQMQGTLKPDAKPGQYPLTVRAAGYSMDGEKTELECTVYIKIEETASTGENQTGEKTEDHDADSIESNGTETGGYGNDGGDEGTTEEPVRQPKLLLVSDRLPDTDLEAGSETEMELAFMNCSREEGIYNLKISAAVGEAGVRLKQNSWYYEFVGAQKTVTLTQTVDVGQNMPEGDHAVTYTFEYEDEKGTAFTGTEVLSLSVHQPVQMELEIDQIPSNLFSTDTVEIPVKTMNLSRTSVYNVRLHLEGCGLFPAEDVFIGNLEAGTAGEGAMRVYVGTRTMDEKKQENSENEEEKYGDVTGTITLYYEDASGKTYQEVKEYQTRIEKPRVVALQVEEEKEANPWWISVIAVILAGMAALIVMLLVLLRGRAHRLKEAQMQTWLRDQKPERGGP